MKINNNERIDDLEYENLKIIQNKEGFCFGIDSVLLSDYAKNIKKDAIVVDIGTGTGIIGLLLCKKAKLKKIYGVEIQEDVAKMAERSIQLNSLEDKFQIINIDINNISDKLDNNSIDVIVTNPPYKKKNTGLLNEEEKKLISRHEIKCTLEDIVKTSYKLLKSKGEFYMVHRAERLVDILYTLRNNKLEPKNIRFVHSKAGEKPKLILIRCVKDAKEYLKIENPLFIYDNNGEYTDEILKIYNKK
ncbi:MAG: tRNA1(Val) (adenine(37)-N6)-methyltransferase [Clostridia bacterium]|nr:tRNA1(Val) (adenine(37)-N6)-methyltransferase [Clostridia bacterium]